MSQLFTVSIKSVPELRDISDDCFESDELLDEEAERAYEEQPEPHAPEGDRFDMFFQFIDSFRSYRRNAMRITLNGLSTFRTLRGFSALRLSHNYLPF